jgi:uncharacterized protein YdhG (YjbR/CyaY superfamily)
MANKKTSPYGTVKFTSIEQYHETFPSAIQTTLQQLREAIRQAAPKAAEMISYNMPAFKQNSVLVYYAAYKNHIGFYPTSSPMSAFEKELTDFKTSKGAIQFPIGKELPVALIKKIVKFRVAEDSTKAKASRKNKP